MRLNYRILICEIKEKFKLVHRGNCHFNIRSMVAPSEKVVTINI